MGPTGEEDVPALPLMMRRKVFGYTAPILLIPLFALKAYQVSILLSSGTPLGSPGFINDLMLLFLGFILGVVLPWWAPVYGSRYVLTPGGLTIERFLRGSKTIPYRSILRAEIYVRNQPSAHVSKEALRYAKNSVEALRRGGFRFSDYTNSDEIIVLLITEGRVYMVSPEDPRAFAKRLRSRAPKLAVKLVEMTTRGKRVRDL